MFSFSGQQQSSIVKWMRILQLQKNLFNMVLLGHPEAFQGQDIVILK